MSMQAFTCSQARDRAPNRAIGIGIGIAIAIGFVGAEKADCDCDCDPDADADLIRDRQSNVDLPKDGLV